jgi:hypothetical protein
LLWVTLNLLMCREGIQSRQSAKLFDRRRNWESVTTPPPPQVSVHPPPLVQEGGGVHTRLRERGWGSPNSDEGTYSTLWYSVLHKYFVREGGHPTLHCATPSLIMSLQKSYTPKPALSCTVTSQYQ